ncbi:hypothetical protein R0137_11080 [Congregibacter brevis]|uniref:Uncharacterized protein n=1 Tax=Congregibacter brevis TaxID=3081201 RepID=A0ABZ0I9I4_9GAMM|nr:hypothetical protein R0137_11080 [Congregibacter sp. IMCC45268]
MSAHPLEVYQHLIEVGVLLDYTVSQSSVDLSRVGELKRMALEAESALEEFIARSDSDPVQLRKVDDAVARHIELHTVAAIDEVSKTLKDSILSASAAHPIIRESSTKRAVSKAQGDLATLVMQAEVDALNLGATLGDLSRTLTVLMTPEWRSFSKKTYIANLTDKETANAIR